MRSASRAPGDARSCAPGSVSSWSIDERSIAGETVATPGSENPNPGHPFLWRSVGGGREMTCLRMGWVEFGDEYYGFTD